MVTTEGCKRKSCLSHGRLASNMCKYRSYSLCTSPFGIQTTSHVTINKEINKNSTTDMHHVLFWNLGPDRMPRAAVVTWKVIKLSYDYRHVAVKEFISVLTLHRHKKESQQQDMINNVIRSDQIMGKSHDKSWWSDREGGIAYQILSPIRDRAVI